MMGNRSILVVLAVLILQLSGFLTGAAGQKGLGPLVDLVSTVGPAAAGQIPVDNPLNDFNHSALPAQTEAGPLSIRATLSHREYARSNPKRLLLKVDFASTINAPPERPPLKLVLVLDRSLSMGKEQKLRFTLDAARSVVENMTARDFISIVAYNDRVTVLSPAGRAVNKAFLFHRLEEITAEGTTDLSAGLLEGIAQVNGPPVDGEIRHILLLTDGLANRGVTSSNALRKIAAKARARGIGLSTLGCGTDFNEELLKELSVAGGGRYTFVDSAEQIPAAFEEELQGLLQVIAQNVRVELRVDDGGEIIRLFGQLMERPTQFNRYDIGTLRVGERGILFAELNPLKFSPEEAINVEVNLIFDDPEKGMRVRRTVRTRSSFIENWGSRDLKENQAVLLYGDVLDALEIVEEALSSLDVERYRMMQTLYDQTYQRARQYALETRDQELLNGTFLLKHFMQELAAVDKENLIHGHLEARNKLKKEVDYRRYLLMHHRPQRKETHPD